MFVKSTNLEGLSSISGNSKFFPIKGSLLKPSPSQKGLSLAVPSPNLKDLCLKVPSNIGVTELP